MKIDLLTAPAVFKYNFQILVLHSSQLLWRCSVTDLKNWTHHPDDIVSSENEIKIQS